MIVSIKVVVMSVDVDISLGGGGVDTTPGQSICPANTETANVRLSMVAAHIWRKVFTLVAPSK